MILLWNEYCSELGWVSPNGCLTTIAMVVTGIIIVQGYVYIVQQSWKHRWAIPQHIDRCSFQSDVTAKTGFRSEVFDADADMVVVDNAANCIIWRHKKHFVPSTHTLLNPATTLGVNTAAGKGIPIAVGNVNLSWQDDNAKTHSYLLPGVLHLPDSPANVWGISAFSRILGDLSRKGTQVNSSGTDTIFTWDDH